MAQTTSQFTPEEQARIDAAVKNYQDRSKQAEIDAAIRNKIMDEERKQPGKTGY